MKIAIPHEERNEIRAVLKNLNRIGSYRRNQTFFQKLKSRPARVVFICGLLILICSCFLISIFIPFLSPIRVEPKHIDLASPNSEKGEHHLITVSNRHPRNIYYGIGFRVYSNDPDIFWDAINLEKPGFFWILIDDIPDYIFRDIEFIKMHVVYKSEKSILVVMNQLLPQRTDQFEVSFKNKKRQNMDIFFESFGFQKKPFPLMITKYEGHYHKSILGPKQHDDIELSEIYALISKDNIPFVP